MTTRRSPNGTLLADDEVVLGEMHGVEIIGERPLTGPASASIDEVREAILRLRVPIDRENLRLASIRITRR